MLDLPQLYTRPPASDLLSILNRLKLQPISWDPLSRGNLSDGGAKRQRINEAGVPKYLTGIIASSLSWVEDESVREEIYKAASARLAERSGRTGGYSYLPALFLLDLYVWPGPFIGR